MSEDPPAPIRHVMVCDTARFTLSGEDVAMLVHQRGGLVAATRYLVDLWRAAGEPPERHRLAIAATLTAHAAIDAMLNEWAYGRSRTLYREWRREGVDDRSREFLAQCGRPVPAGIGPLSAAKNAIGHSEPDNPRSGEAGAWIAGDGAERALEAVIELERALFEL